MFQKRLALRGERTAHFLDFLGSGGGVFHFDHGDAVNGIGQCIDSFLTFDRLLRGAFGAAGFLFRLGRFAYGQIGHFQRPFSCPAARHMADRRLISFITSCRVTFFRFP